MAADTRATGILHGGPLDGRLRSLTSELPDRRGRREVQKELAIVQDGIAHVYLLIRATPRDVNHRELAQYHYAYKCTFKTFRATG